MGWLGEHGEVCRPHIAVEEPRLILHVADEEARHAAHGIGGSIGLALAAAQRGDGVGTEAHLVGEIQQGVDQAAIVAVDCDAARGAGQDFQALGGSGGLQDAGGDDDGPLRAPRHGYSARGEGVLQFLGGPQDWCASGIGDSQRDVFAGLGLG
jgi:hypothetical protein